MAKRRGPKPKSIPMTIGNDPALWRFASVQEALEANVHLIAQLIRAGEEHAQGGQQEKEPLNPALVSESA